jgi:hypothetical protein
MNGLSDDGYCRTRHCNRVAAFFVEVKWCRSRQRRPTRVYDGELCTEHFHAVLPILVQTLDANQVLEITRMGVRRPWARQRTATSLRRLRST